MEVVSAGPQHVELLAPLFNAYRSFFTHTTNLPDSEPYLKARLTRGEAVVFLALADREAAGFILLYPLWSSWHCKRIWFLSDLYVAEAYRKRGTGALLVERVKAYAEETQASSVMVELPHSEPHLEAFYDRLGFHRDAIFDLARYTP